MGKRSSIGIFDFTTKGHTMSYATDLRYLASHHATDEVRGSLAFNGWIGGQNQFFGLHLLDARLQLI
jgi:hypothetical protein